MMMPVFQPQRREDGAAAAAASRRRAEQAEETRAPQLRRRVFRSLVRNGRASMIVIFFDIPVGHRPFRSAALYASTEPAGGRLRRSR